MSPRSCQLAKSRKTAILAVFPHFNGFLGKIERNGARGSIPTAILHRKRYVWVTLLNFYFLPTAPILDAPRASNLIQNFSFLNLGREGVHLVRSYRLARSTCDLRKILARDFSLHPRLGCQLYMYVCDRNFKIQTRGGRSVDRAPATRDLSPICAQQRSDNVPIT